VNVLASSVPALEGWGEFYVIVGTSAGALTGLMFVVIALGSDGGSKRSLDLIEAFATPTVVHLATVLLLSAILTVPRHSETSLFVCLVATGLCGIGYSAWVMQLVRRQSGYEEFLADRVWRTMLPIVSYIAVLVSAVVLFADGDVALYMVAGAGLALLFAAVHNAWDSAIWISSEHD
jgi:hypothetical protein